MIDFIILMLFQFYFVFIDWFHHYNVIYIFTCINWLNLLILFLLNEGFHYNEFIDIGASMGWIGWFLSHELVIFIVLICRECWNSFICISKRGMNRLMWTYSETCWAIGSSLPSKALPRKIHLESNALQRIHVQVKLLNGR